MSDDVFFIPQGEVCVCCMCSVYVYTRMCSYMCVQACTQKHACLVSKYNLSLGTLKYFSAWVGKYCGLVSILKSHS